MSEWISVGERLPEDGDEVLVWGTVHGNHWFHILITYEDCGFQEFIVSHWMPLPEPPK